MIWEGSHLASRSTRAGRQSIRCRWLMSCGGEIAAFQGSGSESIAVLAAYPDGVLDGVVQTDQPSGECEVSEFRAHRGRQSGTARLGLVQYRAQGVLVGALLEPGLRDHLGQGPKAGELDGLVQPRRQRAGPANLKRE